MVIVGKITTTILLCESYVKRTKNMNIESSTGCVVFSLLSIALTLANVTVTSWLEKRRHLCALLSASEGP